MKDIKAWMVPINLKISNNRLRDTYQVMLDNYQVMPDTYQVMLDTYQVMRDTYQVMQAVKKKKVTRANLLTLKRCF